jgi:hypothetical protein
MKPAIPIALIAAGFLLALSKGKKSSKKVGASTARIDPSEVSVLFPYLASRGIRLSSMVWPHSDFWGMTLGEGENANYLRSIGVPVGPGGRLVLPSEPVSQAEQAAWIKHWQIIDGVAAKWRFDPMTRTTVPVIPDVHVIPTVAHYSLDASRLPPDSVVGDEYSMKAYFYSWSQQPDKDGNLRGDAPKLVDPYGREYPPGEYHFGDAGGWLAELGSQLGAGIIYSASSMGPALQSFKGVFNTVTSSPLWQYTSYLASFFPGWGTAVSVGMTMLASYGQGMSLQDAELAAIRAAIPPYAQLAFDVGVAISNDESAENILLGYARKEVPPEYREEFDLGVAEGKKRLGR